VDHFLSASGFAIICARKIRYHCTHEKYIHRFNGNPESLQSCWIEDTYYPGIDLRNRKKDAYKCQQASSSNFTYLNIWFKKSRSGQFAV